MTIVRPAIQTALILTLLLSLSSSLRAEEAESATDAEEVPADPAPEDVVDASELPVSTYAVYVLEGSTGAAGSGFAVKWNDRFFLVTNIHVLDGSPQMTARNAKGERLQIDRFITARDRDLVIVPMATEPSEWYTIAEHAYEAASPGTRVYALGNSKGAGVVTATRGEVLSLGPTSIEVSTPIFRGNSGGPVIDAGTGVVLGMITFALQSIDENDELDLASFANADSAISGEFRYFAVRLDEIEGWLPMTLAEFERQRKAVDGLLEVYQAAIDAYLSVIYERYPHSRYTSHSNINRALQQFVGRARTNLGNAEIEFHARAFLRSLINEMERGRDQLNAEQLHWWFHRERDALDKIHDKVTVSFEELRSRLR